MTPGRWVLLCVMVLLVIFLLLNVYYRSIQAPVWAEQNRVKAAAAEAAELVAVYRADKHVWDSVTWVVQGLNERQQDVFVWVTEQSTAIVPASEGIPKSQIKEKVLADKPGINLIRISPGMLRGERIWEVFYSRNGNATKYYYEFYRFSDGSFVTVFNLPSKFSGSTE